jgi:hypothetical protein
MAEFIAFDLNVEVLGQSLFSLVEGTQGRILGPLAKYGISELKPDEWYPQQTILDAMKDLSHMSDMVSMGMNVIQHALFPPHIDSVESALASIDVAYHMNHRNGEIGSYGVEVIGPRHVRMVVKTPYSSDFDYGLIYGVARRFQPPDSHLTVKVDLTQPTRQKGADSCTYDVTW